MGSRWCWRRTGREPTWDGSTARTSAEIHLHDVGIHDASAGGGSKEEFLRRCDQFGIRPEHRDLVVPSGEVAGIERLIDRVR